MVEREVPKEISGREQIKHRVLGFFAGADSSLNDGRVQQVGLWQVTVQRSLRADGRTRTRYEASIHGTPVAEHSVVQNPAAETVSEAYVLKGTMHNNPADLYVNERLDEPPIARATYYDIELRRLRDVAVEQIIDDTSRYYFHQTFGIQF